MECCWKSQICFILLHWTTFVRQLAMERRIYERLVTVFVILMMISDSCGRYSESRNPDRRRKWQYSERRIADGKSDSQQNQHDKNKFLNQVQRLANRDQRCK